MKITRVRSSSLSKSKKLSLLLALTALCAGLVVYFTQESAKDIQTSDFLLYAPPGKVYFYKDYSYKGEMFEMDVDSRNNVNIAQSFCNDCIRSMKVGPGVRVKLCNRENCEFENNWGESIQLVGPYNTGFLLDWKDYWISHAQLFHYDRKSEPMVQMFVWPKYDCGQAGVFGVGTYDYEQMRQHQIDKVNSFNVPDGAILIMYWDDKFRGKEKTVVGPRVADLREDEEFKKEAWAENIRSFQIIKESQIDVTVKWVLVASLSGGDQITEDVKYGWTSTDSHETETTISNTFEVGTEFGFEFEGLSFKQHMTSTQSKVVRELSQKGFSESEERTTHVSCNSKSDEVSLWQWVLVADKGSEKHISVKDANFVCRYGANFNSPPQCPLGYCKDAECNECNPAPQSTIAE